MLGLTPPSNADSNLTPRPESETKILPMPKVFESLEKPPKADNTNDLLLSDKAKLLYYVNKVIGIYCLCMPPSMASYIFILAYGKGYLAFSRCYKNISYFWFIYELTNLLWVFICYYP